MGKKRKRSEPREQRSPVATVANASDDFIEDLSIPALPDGIPQRLEDAIRNRINALFFQLREAKTRRYAHMLEVRLVREAYQAVLTANELNMSESKILYAEFRRLVEDLGYESTHVGFRKDPYS